MKILLFLFFLIPHTVIHTYFVKNNDLLNSKELQIDNDNATVRQITYRQLEQRMPPSHNRAIQRLHMQQTIAQNPELLAGMLYGYNTLKYVATHFCQVFSDQMNILSFPLSEKNSEDLKFWIAESAIDTSVRIGNLWATEQLATTTSSRLIRHIAINSGTTILTLALARAATNIKEKYGLKASYNTDEIKVNATVFAGIKTILESCTIRILSMTPQYLALL